MTNRGAELADALRTGQIVTHFQPEIRLDTGSLVGFEALARWAHPERGTIPPEEFIPLAEESGLIHDLGREVLRAACEALAVWLDATPERPMRVAVNVSARQLLDPTFPDAVREIIAATGVPAGRVCLEVTESALVDIDDASATLRRLKASGVELAIDDFGTGYSSLSRLHRFPLDYLKIDCSFVSEMTDRNENAVIVAAIVSLGRALGLRTVAEGIENQASLAALTRLGCDIGQGFLWGPVLSAADAGLMVASPRPRTAVDISSREPVASSDDGTDDDDTDESAASVGMAILVHELATPVALLAGFAEVLATSTDPEVRARSIEPVRRATRRAHAALALVKDVSALDAGSLTVDREPIALRTVVSEAVEMIDDLDDSRCHVDVDEVVFEGDTDRLVMAVSNLIGNAVKHSPPGSSISVLGAIEGDSAVLQVIDDGPGVPPDQVGVIFQRFGRLHRTREGTGLGLYLARGIVRAHGGELRCRPAPGGGAEFVMELPLMAQAAASHHAVHIYDNDQQLVRWVADSFATAVAAGRATLMVATPAHRRAIEQELRSRGVSLDGPHHRALDAAATLDGLLTDGDPDPVLFDRVVAPEVAALSDAGHGLTVFGEMVDLLWDRGHVAAATALENSWNTLGTKLDFSLLCGYKAVPEEDLAAFDGVAALHTQVLRTTAPAPPRCSAHQAVLPITTPDQHLVTPTTGAQHRFRVA